MNCSWVILIFWGMIWKWLLPIVKLILGNYPVGSKYEINTHYKILWLLPRPLKTQKNVLVIQGPTRGNFYPKVASNVRQCERWIFKSNSCIIHNAQANKLSQHKSDPKIHMYNLSIHQHTICVHCVPLALIKDRTATNHYVCSWRMNIHSAQLLSMNYAWSPSGQQTFQAEVMYFANYFSSELSSFW